MSRIYLDIDGVLLTLKRTQAAEHSPEFINYILDNFDCYWLTTHCKGNAKTAIAYLTNYFSSDIIRCLQAIKPTNWDVLKTEALDYSTDFVWVDDAPLQAEKQVLSANNILHRLFIVNLNQKDELKRVIDLLQIQKTEGRA